jgi:hypothetical protein
MYLWANRAVNLNSTTLWILERSLQTPGPNVIWFKMAAMLRPSFGKQTGIFQIWGPLVGNSFKFLGRSGRNFGRK